MRRDLSGWRPAWLAVGLACLAAAACSDDRDTLLQLEVRYPQALASFQTLEFTVGEDETRSYRPPAAIAGADADVAAEVAGAVDAAADGSLGLDVDMRLPRSLVGPQTVAVSGLDGAGCVIAWGTVDVELRAGARVDGGIVWLAATDPGSCGATGDAAAERPGADDGGADDARASDGGAEQPRTDGGGAEAARPDGGGGSSDGGSGGDARDAGPADAPPADTAPPRQACTSASPCPSGKNCLAGYCEAAPAACADIAAKDASLGDGVYWLTVAGTAVHAYCDMRIKSALCTETAGEHTGQTRDSAHIGFKLSSQLEYAAGRCKIWAVRNASDGYPLDKLLDRAVSSAPSKTCASLGFKADVSLGACSFGADPGFTDCGFALGGSFYKWGNTCDCSTRPNYYTREGKIYQSTIPWNKSGSVFGRCSVR